MSESGPTAVLVATEVFVQLAETSAAALGARDLPILAVAHPLGGIDRSSVEAKALEAIERLAAIADKTTPTPLAAATERAPAPRRLRVERSVAEIIEFVKNPPWSDGLPVVLPTVDMVAAMTAASGRPADEIVAVLSPRFGDATVEPIAANAVMAGCRPEAMPLLVAAVEAMADPAFNLPGVQATTHPAVY